MITDLTPAGRLAPLRLAGSDLTADVAEAIVGAPSLSLTTDGVSELGFEVSDPDFVLLKSGIFARGTRVAYLDLRLSVAEVAVRDIGGRPGLAIAARSAGGQKLRRVTGGRVWRNQSPTQVIRAEAVAAGLAFVGQDSPKRSSILRAKPKAGEETESSWDLGQRLADELGFVAFEAAGTFYFGKPSYLVGRAVGITVRYPEARPGEADCLSVPDVRRTIDDPKAPVSGSVELHPDVGLRVRPGYVLVLAGVPTFTGRYLVTDVTIGLSAAAPVMVGFETPTDPTPNPPDSGTGGSDTAGSGSGRTRAGVSSAGFRWPVQGRISSVFGDDRPEGRTHAGVDIAAASGTRIVAAKSGRVVAAGDSGNYGLMIELDHGGGQRTRYAHCSRIAASAGQTVTGGQVIGYVGNTGTSSGSHCHFEVRVSGTAVDPVGYLP